MKHTNFDCNKMIMIFLLLLSLGNAKLLQPPFFPFIQCYLRFAKLEFDVSNYEKYEEYFDENSAAIVSETGVFKGPSDIEEYMKIYDKTANPFFENTKVIAGESSYQGYDRENEQCEFLTTYTLCTTNDLLTTGSNMELCTAVMVQAHFSFFERKISRLYIFFYRDYWRQIFSILATDESRKVVCSTANVACAGIIDPIPNCTDKIAMLPILNDGYVDGNSQGCRVLHTILAIGRPKTHCAHIAINPTRDPSGLFKCQTSLFMEPKDFFTDEEFSYHDEYARSQGIDPAVGFSYNS